MLASNESPLRPARAGQSRPPARALAGSQPLSRPLLQAAAPGAVGPLRRAAGSASRLAPAPATCSWPPARRCSSPAPRSSTHGPRSACTRTSPPPRAPARSRCRSTPRSVHDLDAIAAEVTVATRLVLICNPNNPTWTALALEDIEPFLKRVPAHVCVILDEAYCEFSLTIGDTYRVAPAAQPLPEPRDPANLLQGLRARRAARRLRPLRQRSLPDRGRPGAPAVLPD